MKKLSPVVRVNESRCVNCNVCIRVCPVRYCNDGSSGRHIDLNHDLCIGCGSCIRACTHGAREIVDDTEQFLSDLRRGVKMIAIVAPAIAANFPERYFQFNTWLRSLGIKAVFDVSFGAELTVKSYLEYIKAKNPELVIAQPCPAIVTYIQIYRPELIPYLAPAHSPMLHTIQMIREFYTQFADHKIVVISPCIAKKREFEETQLGDYNVTMAKLGDYLTEHKINLDRFEPTDYDNPAAERAVLFSTPGGLMRTAMREVTGIEENIRKIEGPGVYHYLDHLDASRKAKTNPLLIDCLNCELGCNAGSGTKHTRSRSPSQDELESSVEHRSNALRELYTEEQKKYYSEDHAEDNEDNYEILHQQIDSYWKPSIYNRHYQNLRENNTIKQPTTPQRDLIYSETLLKKGDADILNCGACGYHTCGEMATALHNKLSRSELCFHKQQNELKLSEEGARAQSEKQEKFTSAFFREIEGMVKQVKETARLMREINDGAGEIANVIDVVSRIARQTNLLALNASIEAARAGKAGAGFSVVAEEVRKLAKSSNEAATRISELVGESSGKIAVGTDLSQKLESELLQIMEEARSAMIDSLNMASKLKHLVEI
ncbi:MAG: methyl-accepting chemotaxis protein [Planctomycetaceae bacterium]|jgi:iron only hydrogenase large subunit-like protein|nr:methyl-accepting chemotaxis protein [Planctomycetaceae bacterium]